MFNSVLSHDPNAAELAGAQVRAGTLIALGPTQSILLGGVPLSSLHPNNFQFV